MELKRYQKGVLDDLQSYLALYAETGDPKEAFRRHWAAKGYPVGPKAGEIKDYFSPSNTCPDTCLKIPTGGGKTFMAASSLKPIFDTIPADMKLVMWLVPSKAILEQTVASLKDGSHPYHRQLVRDFGNNIAVYSSDELIEGAVLSPSSMFERLTICVMCYASLRTRDADRLKMYQTNGSLQAFGIYLRGREDQSIGDDYSLMRIFNALKPVIVLDEGHNATSKLSRKMLTDLNPRYILELTATPSEYSNPISIVTALQLKEEHMVKIPLVVYERGQTDDALLYAKRLRDGLEDRAKQECAESGRYLRPIVLIQAEPNRSSEAVTFEAARRKLIEEIGVPSEHIAIKVSGTDGPSVRELLSRNCEIRYLITVNAIKEGWDCSFAYILVSLNETGTPTAVEQIIGRIMRMPDATPFKDYYLNVCYVFAVSNRFNDTLQSVAQGLLLSGFSRKDYHTVRSDNLDRYLEEQEPNLPEAPVDSDGLPQSSGTDIVDVPSGPLDSFGDGEERTGPIIPPTSTEVSDEDFENMMDELGKGIKKAEQEYEKESGDGETEKGGVDMRRNIAVMRERFQEEVLPLRIPVMMERAYSRLLGTEFCRPVDSSTLSEGLKLGSKDTSIDFEAVRNTIVKMDVVKGTSGETLERINFKEREREAIRYAMRDASDMSKEALVSRLMKVINTQKYNDIDSSQISAYVRRVIDNVSEEDLSSITQDYAMAATAIRSKLDSILLQHRIERFYDLRNSGKLITAPDQPNGYFSFKRKLDMPNSSVTTFEKSLYDRVGPMDSFEMKVINLVDGMENIVWWHRFSNKGPDNYKIGGFINHYPDFMVRTRSGCIILVETKGNDRDNTNSQYKVDLGKAWESVMGQGYRYFMVFETPETKVKGAITHNQLIQYLSEL